MSLRGSSRTKTLVFEKSEPIGQWAKAQLLNESQRDKEAIRLFWQRHKSKVQTQIPIPGLLIQGIQDERIHPHLLASLLYLRHGAQKHALAEFLPLESSVHGQSSQQNDADRTGRKFLLGGWQLLTLHRAGDESKVALNLRGARVGHDHVGHSQMTVCILPGLLAQKTVKRLLTAVEGLTVVMSA